MRKALFIFTFFILNLPQAFSQDHVNLKGGYAAEGYDVVSYFQNNPLKGDKRYTAKFDGVSYKFASEENLKTFKENPSHYIPQYGGFCAYAIAKDGKKVGVNPKTFTITDGKLYLFYNSWGVNTLNKWNEEDPEALRVKADTAWDSILKNQ